MRIALVATGGTIASRATPDGVVANVAGAEILAAMGPGRVAGGAEVSVVDVGLRGSYSLTLDEMHDVAQRVRVECLGGADGVVVTHGTDSLEETSFLTDLLHEEETPVVFTGAQRPFDAADGDGLDNLALALSAASSHEWRGKGVLVAFGGRVMPARGVRKVHTTQLGAFDNPSYRGLDDAVRSTLPGAAVRLGSLAMPQVEVVAAVPGGSGFALRDAVRRRPAGIVFQALGMGNASREDTAVVRDAVAQGIPVLITTRVQRGPVQAVYGDGGGKTIEQAGAVFADDLTTWQARILLSVCLALGPDGRAEHNVATWLARFASGLSAFRLARTPR